MSDTIIIGRGPPRLFSAWEDEVRRSSVRTLALTPASPQRRAMESHVYALQRRLAECEREEVVKDTQVRALHSPHPQPTRADQRARVRCG